MIVLLKAKIVCYHSSNFHLRQSYCLGAMCFKNSPIKNISDSEYYSTFIFITQDLQMLSISMIVFWKGSQLDLHFLKSLLCFNKNYNSKRNTKSLVLFLSSSKPFFTQKLIKFTYKFKIKWNYRQKKHNIIMNNFTYFYIQKLLSTIYNVLSKFWFFTLQQTIHHKTWTRRERESPSLCFDISHISPCYTHESIFQTIGSLNFYLFINLKSFLNSKTSKSTRKRKNNLLTFI